LNVQIRRQLCALFPAGRIKNLVSGLLFWVLFRWGGKKKKKRKWNRRSL